MSEENQTAETVNPEDELKPSEEGQEFLKKMGLTLRSAKRILANGKNGRYLNTKITARVLMVDQVNGIEQIMLAQRNANRYARNPDMPFRDRVACLAVVAQSGMALARLSEVSLATARALDDPEEDASTRVVKPVQNNYFGFPPVVKAASLESANPATNGNTPVTEIKVDVKSA